MKKFLPTLLAAAILTTIGCTTLSNRRDLYFPQKVEGPYTRMLKKWTKKSATNQTSIESDSTSQSKHSF
ncbi:MAG: hypothetical protein N2035_05270 [Chthoniobacterales bacterium]|nr:hypothetical protein [Chthoniobacterales bacterium]